MNDINFFSRDKYLYLPNIKNPKVILAVSNASISQNAYKLYNPFSFKGKILKNVSQFLMVHCHPFIPFLIPTKLHQKSDFTDFLEKKLNCKLHISIYQATDKNKVVLQLQSQNKIYGYLKFPLNKTGIMAVKAEKNAIENLSQKNIISPYILANTYEGIPFLIIAELKGKIENISDQTLEKLVLKLKKGNSYQLRNHPRVQTLYAALKKPHLKVFEPLINTIIKNSTLFYYEVHEHGDFAPWNIINTGTGYIPFDFEFYVANGIEYFDLIKYHFQVGRLLKKKNHIQLSHYVFSKINHIEIKHLTALFLIKEIIRMDLLNENYQFQETMLNYICE